MDFFFSPFIIPVLIAVIGGGLLLYFGRGLKSWPDFYPSPKPPAPPLLKTKPYTEDL